ncbi:hypothetical protein Tco_0593070 [Tanacetum coccineum]
MPTEMELTLEQTQQGVSYEVSVSIEGVEDEKKLTLCTNPSQPLKVGKKDFVSKLTEIHSFLLTFSLELVDIEKVDPYGFEGYLKMVVEVP